MTRSRLCLALVALSALAMLAAPGGAGAAGQPLVLKLGTLAPDGSAWHLILKDMAQQWQKASAGRVELRIFPGGTAGDEPDMVRKMRFGQLHAATLTIIGMSRIAPGPQVLSLPGLVDDYAELDCVRERLAPRLEAELAGAGYVALNWGDAGWLRYFSTKPVRTPDDMRKLKMFVWAGDQESVDMWKDYGFQPVPLAMTDVLASMQTGMIDAAPMTAATALASQMHSAAKYMADLRWSPIVGGTVIAAKSWDKVPEDVRPQLQAIALEAGRRLRDEIRRLDADAVASMQKRGLEVLALDAEARRAWFALAEEAYPRVRERFVGAATFDAALAVRDACRKDRAAAPAGTGQGGGEGAH